jgi:4-hydroxybenzoyl-CoA thioesterase
MAFTYLQKVRFKHCDPAGIVFYPRYFEMMNDCIEAFFETELGVPFEVLHQSHSVPTAAIETTFHAPSRHGDALVLTLRLTRLGRSSLGYEMQADCGAESRFTTMATLVHITAQDGRPEPWPAPMRDRIEHIMETQR